MLGVMLGNESCVFGLGDVIDRYSEEGVGEGGGAGSAHSSCEDVMVGSEGSSIDDGVGDGGMHGSAQSSVGDMVLVMVVGALRVFDWDVGVIVHVVWFVGTKVGEDDEKTGVGETSADVASRTNGHPGFYSQ